jgi:uncharacterized protein YrrD
VKEDKFMRKGSDIIGKQIIDLETGERFGRVKDLIFDQNENLMLALLVEEKGLFKSAQILPLRLAQAIGLDAVIAPSKKAVIEAKQVPEIHRILEGSNVLKGTRIMTLDGRDLGRMTDLYFDEETGAIEGYEVSGGMFADAYSGRSFVPAPKTLTIGEDFAFVPVDVTALMEEQVGGIKGALQATGEKVQEAAQWTGERLQTATEEAGYQLETARQQTLASITNLVVDPAQQKAFVVGKVANETVNFPAGDLLVAQGHLIVYSTAEKAEQAGILDQLYRAAGGSVTQKVGENLQITAQAANEQVKTAADQAGEKLRDAKRDATLSATNVIASYTVDQAKGRRVQQIVRTREGLIVAAPGQIVTDRVIERAKLYRQEYALLQAVGLSTTGAAHARANDAITLFSDRLETTTQKAGLHFNRGNIQVQEGTRGLWEQLKEMAAEFKEQSVRAIEEHRIKRALGRPATRVILDTGDRVILNVGDLITHQAIESARQANVLDILLNSVSRQTPEFTRQELQASKPGRASLEAIR